MAPFSVPMGVGVIVASLRLSLCVLVGACGDVGGWGFVLSLRVDLLSSSG